MAEFTREQLTEQAKWVRANLAPLIKSADADHAETMSKNDRLMEIALAALTAGMEQEPVIIVGDDGGDALAYRRLIQTFAPGTKLYAAPQLPQPAVVSDEMIDTFEAEFRMAFEVSPSVEHLLEIECQGCKFSLSIRDAAAWWKLGRAAMLKHSAPFIVTSDHRMMEMPKDEYIDTVAAMLQGAEPVQEQHETAGSACECRSNEKVQALQDGWVAVPVEPTAEMQSAAAGAIRFDTTPINKLWTGNAVYKAMLATAPHFREIGNSSTNNFLENAETSTKCWCHTCRPVTISDMRFVVCPDCGNKRCPHANDHRNTCTGSNELGQEGSAYPAAPQQEVK
ncbi:hypothetical protein M8320_15085 [Leclercia sp. H6W5]|uniref:hypothetical protein n=1 Tax=Leclercia tamurae TaxID=2926467 RepID=UPI0021CE8872|nr:hypothetical protein [Leclercia tamurae]MCU6683316.1 hypothetical protein [Leclercia tamurae]